MILYAQLRQKTLQTLRGASKVTPKVEWEFVLHNARLYSRMGCDLLGLDLGMSNIKGSDLDLCLEEQVLTSKSPKLGIPQTSTRRFNQTWWRDQPPYNAQAQKFFGGGGYASPSACLVADG